MAGTLNDMHNVAIVSADKNESKESIISEYNGLTDSSYGFKIAYCMMTMIVFARRAGIPESVIPTTASCTNMELWAKDQKQFYTKGQVGDIILFQDFDDIPDDSDHTGWVYKVEGKYIYTVEGNNGQDYNHVTYNRYDASWSKIRGYVRPKYQASVVEKVSLTGTTTATDGLNIRSGAGTSFNAVGTYPLGSKVTVSERTSNWGKTDKGWICLDYIEIEQTTTPQRDPEKYYTLDDVKKRAPYWLPEITEAIEMKLIGGDGVTELGGISHSQLWAAVLDVRAASATQDQIDELKERIDALENDK